MILFKRKPKKVALVLGGGGSRGLAHIGVIKAFEENGINFDYVVGTSAGSIVGAVYAAGMKSDEMIKFAKELKVKDIRKNILPFTPSSTSGLKELINKAIGEKNIEDLPKQFCAVAVDVISGNEVHLTRGSVADAVAGSCALPGIFYPVEFEKYRLYDGGLSNTIPSNVPKILYDCDAVIAVDVNSTRGYGTDSEKYLDQMMACFRIMMKSNALKGYINSEIMLQPDLKRFKSTSLDFVDQIIDEGYNCAVFNMDKILSVLKGTNFKKKDYKEKITKNGLIY